MKIVALNVVKPRMVKYKGKDVSTGIYKTPVEGPHMVSATNIDGDGQADLTVHGGTIRRSAPFPLGITRSMRKHWAMSLTNPANSAKI